MRKSAIIFSTVFLCILLYAIIDTVCGDHRVEAVESDTSHPSTPLPFRKGERLVYEVRYNKLKVGRSTLTFNGEKELDGKKVYQVSFFTRVPSIKDSEEIYADEETFLPVEVRRKIKKKIGFTDNIVERYDQKNFRVDITQKSKLRTKVFSIKKDSPIHNAILLAYYCRLLDSFDKGSSFHVALPTVDFEVIFKGIEKINTPLGEYSAYVFTSNPPRFKLWLSADEKRIPLKIQNPGPLGYSLLIKSIE